MRIGLFIGSFNPPHLTHFNIAEYLTNNNYLDKIYFLPVNISQKKLVSFEDRYQMLKLYTKDKSNMDVLTIEKNNKGYFSYNRYLLIKEQYQSDELFIILGSDSYRNMNTWKNYNEILENCNIIVINRNNDKIKKTNKKTIVIEALGNHSSSNFRKDITNSNGFTIDEIALYIRGKDLYKDIK